MTKNNFHRLLKRQIKEHFGNLDNIPPNIEHFLEAINLAYKDYDKDMTQLEHILKQSSQELFKANKELNLLNSQNEKIIEEKTNHLKKTAYNLQNAEKIAGLGNFSWNISTNSIDLSEQMMAMCGLDNNGPTLQEFIHVFDHPEAMTNAMDEAIKSNTKFTLNNVRIKNDPRFFMMEGEVLNESAEKNDKLFLGILQDTTVSKNKEIELNELLQTLENYKKAVDYAGIVSKSDKFGMITYVNQKFSEISGYKEQELIGANHNVVNSGYHNKAFFTNMWKTISSGEIWKGVIKNKKKDGSFYWVESTIVPFFKNGHVHEFISIRFDITEKIFLHQKVEEQKTFYETILNNIPVDVAVFNKQHQYLFVNPNAVHSASTREFLIGKDDFDYCKHFNKNIEIAEKRRDLFNEVTLQRKKAEFTEKIEKSEGKFAYSLRRFSPVFDANNELIYLIGFGIDITEKTEQSIQIEKSLEEKEALLGEIHHRVKNNLALVLGLIEMQISKTGNESLKHEFHDVQHRISAMALIHEKLYKSNNFAKINLQEYLQDLIKFLNNFYNKGKDIKIHFDMDEILASTKKAIPIALIVNELITNCCKYAFKDTNHGEIHVTLKKTDEYITLSIADNGPGIPDNVDLTKTNSLGFKLLNIFTKQLKGILEYSNNSGLLVCIKFKNEQESFNS